MTPAPGNPDLRQIGQRAFTEVLGTLLSMSATVASPADHTVVDTPPDPITSRVLLSGQHVSGSVHLQLPQAFVAHAVRRLTGLKRAAAEANGVLDDAAGELANMVAGRIAAQLAAEGYPCSLATPSVSRSTPLLDETEPGVARGRADLLCDGHWLSLEIHCRYALA